jgi:hypothetical protein
MSVEYNALLCAKYPKIFIKRGSITKRNLEEIEETRFAKVRQKLTSENCMKKEESGFTYCNLVTIAFANSSHCYLLYEMHIAANDRAKM